MDGVGSDASSIAYFCPGDAPPLWVNEQTSPAGTGTYCTGINQPIVQCEYAGQTINFCGDTCDGIIGCDGICYSTVPVACVDKDCSTGDCVKVSRTESFLSATAIDYDSSQQPPYERSHTWGGNPPILKVTTIDDSRPFVDHYGKSYYCYGHDGLYATYGSWPYNVSNYYSNQYGTWRGSAGIDGGSALIGVHSPGFAPHRAPSTDGGNYFMGSPHYMGGLAQSWSEVCEHGHDWAQDSPGNEWDYGYGWWMDYNFQGCYYNLGFGQDSTCGNQWDQCDEFGCGGTGFPYDCTCTESGVPGVFHRKYLMFNPATDSGWQMSTNIYQWYDGAAEDDIYYNPEFLSSGQYLTDGDYVFQKHLACSQVPLDQCGKSFLQYKSNNFDGSFFSLFG